MFLGYRISVDLSMEVLSKNVACLGVAGMDGSFRWSVATAAVENCSIPLEGVAENLRFGARGRLSPQKYELVPEIAAGNFWVVRDLGPERREGFPLKNMIGGFSIKFCLKIFRYNKRGDGKL